MSKETDASDKILPLLLELRDELSQGRSSPNLNKSLQEFGPESVMNTLVPYLFREDEKLSSQEALTVMSAMITSAQYLTAASRAVLHHVQKLADSTLAATAGETMTVSPELLQVFVLQLQGTNTQVSENAAHVLVACSRRLGASFVKQAFVGLHQTWQAAWRQMPSNRHSSTIVVRCASAIVDLAVLEDAFFPLAPTEAWTELLEYEDDPLLQLSALDLFERLATKQPYHPSRTLWILSSDSLKSILRLAGSNDDVPPDPLLGGAALRVVAAACQLLHSTPETAPASSELLTAFHHALHNWNESASGEMDRLALVHAISSFASASDTALQLVLDDPVTRQSWLSLRSVAQSKLKAAILVSVAQVLEKTTSSPGQQKLFTAIGPINDQHTTMDLLLTLVKSPMSEVRIGVYALWEAMAPSGAQTLLLHPNFLPLLLQRKQESTAEGRQAKYAIVEAIRKSSVVGLLAEDIVRQLDVYIQQGPHYHKAQTWEVAMEE